MVRLERLVCEDRSKEKNIWVLLTTTPTADRMREEEPHELPEEESTARMLVGFPAGKPRPVMVRRWSAARKREEGVIFWSTWMSVMFRSSECKVLGEASSSTHTVHLPEIHTREDMDSVMETKPGSLVDKVEVAALLVVEKDHWPAGPPMIWKRNWRTAAKSETLCWVGVAEGSEDTSGKRSVMEGRSRT